MAFDTTINRDKLQMPRNVDEMSLDTITLGSMALSVVNLGSSNADSSIFFDIFDTRRDVAVQTSESPCFTGDWRALPANDW